MDLPTSRFGLFLFRSRLNFLLVEEVVSAHAALRPARALAQDWIMRLDSMRELTIASRPSNALIRLLNATENGAWVPVLYW